MDELVILVDEKDNELAYGEKHAVHKAGKLHRCFSIFIFDSHGKMLIQQRAMKKYHSPGLWTNTCCGHPRPKENTKKAAHRRMGEEMGFDCKFEEAFTFTYQAKLDHGMTEHEFDHVFIGKFDGAPIRNPDEVMAWKYINVKELKLDVKKRPNHYTIWFKIALERVLAWKKL